METEIFDQINSLIEETKNIIVCSVDENGCPNAKAMFKTQHEGMKTFLFSTNTSSMRRQQFQENPNACLYFLGANKIRGLMLKGKMEVCMDRELRVLLWEDGCEEYYPLGIDDPDYCVFRFTAEQGNYYSGLKKTIFNVE